ncbi:hypothetical protein BJX63DRAFT_28379 [Aspergillus granulosus]|uniref:AAA+ ATPase domain-containing protein n=1 Tax=Aspergillus granulosus TaxID=176169 RepID=A0ABR4HUI5_9EURO
MAGKCEAIVEYGEFRMPCPCDRFEGLSQPGQPDVSCKRCLHPLSQHGSTSLADIQPEMNDKTPLQKRDADLAEDNILAHLNLAPMYPRPDTVQKLANLVDQQKVVHVRGTPASGKTTLALLLMKYYASQKKNACYFGSWTMLSKISSKTLNPWTLLQLALYRASAGPADHIVPGTILLVDEAQLSYKDESFWIGIIKLLQSGLASTDIKFCLFSSYGNPITGVEHVPYTPATFKPKQRVDFTIQPEGPQLGIFFTELESYHAIDQISKHGRRPLIATFDDKAKDYLFSLTNGHPGCLSALVDFIITKNERCIRHGETIITKDMILESMKIEEKEKDVWAFIKRTDVYRSFPNGDNLTPETRAVLANVLEQGNITHNKVDDALQTCYQLGWLHKTTQPDRLRTTVYVLPSRLHEKWIEYLIGEEMRPLPSQFQSLQELVMTILRGFSTTNLKSAGKVLSSAASNRPVEAQYQDEFYRVFNKVAGRGVPISSEWSRTSRGRVDFWIPEKKWAIELLRDHERIGEHIAQFHRGGRYYDWITDSMVGDWIIINCAISMPDKAFPEPRLIHAIFDHKYEGVRLLDNNLNLLGHHVLTN